MSEFLSMGGYGLYVWTSWGVGIALMIALLIQSVSAARSAAREAEATEQLSPRRRRRKAEVE
ncbi:MAG: heme exporter protein CcmD [Minwuia sp.]|nr:heme exporter protein CcmD [Minwuia sp.]